MKYAEYVGNYIKRISARFELGLSTEHSYRGDLQNLLEAILSEVLVTNEPSRIECGAPDYILTKKNIPVGYIEAKDIGADLKSKSYKEQFERYRTSLPNLVITDYLDFWFYRDKEFVTSIQIATIQNGQIVGNPKKYDEFINLIKDFSTRTGQTIKSSKKLAEMMAGKARMLANVIENALLLDEQKENNTVQEAANITLREQLEAFKQVLIHDIKPKEFADIYAQTIAYGMFAARLHDPTLDTFSRQEAAELIPKSNPFLRKLFQYIAGYDLDDRIKWIVDALADIFRATDVAALLANFGKATQQNDPIIHFYETFLGEYDPKLRKARGVWYTPEPVVNFIVRSVDDILKTEFRLKDGLADTSKTKIKINTQISDKRTSTRYRKEDVEVHKVQILDPATGTGTFLAEVIKQVYKRFEGQEGVWSQYVENHLLPRLNGFEILMASYAMAHLKLDLLLTETGYKPKNQQRFRVYLTNSLEEHHPDTGTLFANWLSSEANEANHIKRDTPVMCVIGNPPYSISSSNKSNWIENLTYDYKKGLIEKSYNSLSDDYVKFIRFGQHFIDKNGEGILAYISNNSFIEGLIHSQMRKNIMETFDNIYILDLHGDAKKKEVCPDGSPDQNVFDIMQGVSINIFVKTTNNNKKTLGKVHHFDLQGKREFKYDFLKLNSINSIDWKLLDCKEPSYFFTNKDFKGEAQYVIGFKVDELFSIYNNGIETGKDFLFYSSNKKELIQRIECVFENKEDAIKKYNIANTSSFPFEDKLRNANLNLKKIRKISYRPFDISYCYYDENLQRRPAYSTMCNMFKSNYALLTPRQLSGDFKHIFISTNPTDCNLTGTAKKFGSAPIFPLYLYPETNGQQTIEQSESRTPNLKAEIVKKIAEKLGLAFTNEKETTENTFAPIDILDYIYAVLHSPSYRDKYKEFLKIDFPRMPYPKDKGIFWQLVKLGGEIRQVHLLESPKVEEYITKYPIDGDNVVGKPKYKEGKVYINDTQYFDSVPQVAWEFYIGGYQPAQKWLKNRKGRELRFEDIKHYQKIIVALTETDRIMKKIDKVEFE